MAIQLHVFQVPLVLFFIYMNILIFADKKKIKIEEVHHDDVLCSIIEALQQNRHQTRLLLYGEGASL